MRGRAIASTALPASYNVQRACHYVGAVLHWRPCGTSHSFKEPSMTKPQLTFSLVAVAALTLAGCAS
ncbi:MAG TPA: hypothetical protein VNB23_14175, partial [Ramlibacter sp.]|nr:hypothetical protein [Ramlibacter sp.]